MHTLELVFQVAVPVVAAVVVLVLLAYHFILVRDALRQLAGFIESTLSDVAGALDRTAASIRRVMASSAKLLTHDEQYPLPLLIVAVTVLMPIVALIVLVEVRLWAGYFESLFPEDIQVPIVGAVSAGLLTAVMPVAAGFLLGWLVEAMLGAFPLPILGGTLGPSGRPRLRGIFAICLLVLWVLLALTVLDAANEVYDALGESTCALRAAGDIGDGAAAPFSDSASPGGQLDSASAQTTCVASWKADDQARSIRVSLGELALHLSALFAWSVVAGAGLLMLLALCVPVAGLALLAVATRVCVRLASGIAALVELLLALVHAVGVVVVRLLRWSGVPLPAAEIVPVTGRLLAPMPSTDLAVADHYFSRDGIAQPPMPAR